MQESRHASSIYRAVLGFGLQGCHDFEIDQIEKLLQKCATAQTIGVDDPRYGEDKEAFDRINFLVDMAETRIRDTIFTGWSKLHGGDGDPDNYNGLVEVFACFRNGFYMEIITIGKVF